MIFSIEINLKDRVEEASIKITKKIFEFLKKNKISVKLNLKKYDILNIHSSGYLNLLGAKNPLIYSYYAMPSARYYAFFKSMIEYLVFFRDKKEDHRSFPRRLLYFFVGSLSYFIPLKIKQKIFGKANTLILALDCAKKQLSIDAKVIKIGIDTNYFRKTKNKKNKKLNIAYVGHNSPIKGLKDAIDTFSQIKHNVDMNIYLSDYSKKVKEYAYRKDKRIKVHGRSKDILKTYNNIDILVLPFRSENAGIVVPLVLVEAMACEKAIITTRLKNTKEICKDSVMYVPPMSVNNIKKAINYLIDKPNIRSDLGIKARNRILKDHNEKDMLESYLRLYKEIDNQNRKISWN